MKINCEVVSFGSLLENKIKTVKSFPLINYIITCPINLSGYIVQLCNRKDKVLNFNHISGIGHKLEFYLRATNPGDV